ncbi:MAG: hypothetical protein JWP50_1716 [Phenylobacterium sp.]|nr:hypothetical protein [Phenylobacterium sp.]
MSAIGRSGHRLNIFKQVYWHIAAWKSATWIAEKLQVPRITVIKEIRPLVQKGIVDQQRRDGDEYYGVIQFYKAHKKEIIKYVEQPDKLKALATKRRPAVTVVVKGQIKYATLHLPQKAFDVRLLTVDDIDSFSAVRSNPAAGNLTGMSENAFKTGVQAIIGEPGEFKDWGGEKSDLFTTRLQVGGRREAAAFAFKGPGQSGKLTMKRMGKNGDQGPRLFHEAASVFLVQHWREIDAQVVDLMRSLAIAKSVMLLGQTVWYGVIDGQDSSRLVRAYPDKFK